MTPSAVKWILFDMADVLVQYRPCGLPRMASFMGVSVGEMQSFFDESRAGELAAVGRIDREQFVALLNNRFDRPVTPAHVVRWFGAEVEAPFPEIPALIRSLKPRYSLGILSNTFFGHWDYFETTELARQFDALMPSHILGYAKPDPRVFREALSRIRSEPGQTLFIDDTQENVDAAQALGILSFRSASPAETAAGLRKFGIAPASA